LTTGIRLAGILDQARLRNRVSRAHRVAVATQALQDPVVDRGTSAVAAVINALSSTLGDRPSLVCIDGLGGAGKSTLAEAVTSERPDVTVVHGDDFYGPPTSDWTTWTPQQGYERYFDHDRLEDQVLRPLRSGSPASFQRYDWSANTLADWVEVDPDGVVIVEGVYLLRPRLRRYWDLAIYVDADRALRQRRMYARRQNDVGWINRWAAAEDYYESVERPSDFADIIVPGY
jgi:uridine kinase